MAPELKKDLIDLASESNGGRTLLVSDDFFAPKENLLKPGRGVFIEDKYTNHGKWMDGNPVENELKDMIGVSYDWENQV